LLVFNWNETEGAEHEAIHPVRSRTDGEILNEDCANVSTVRTSLEGIEPIDATRRQDACL
jgi:hypothetical protein